MILKNEPLTFGFTPVNGETGDLSQWLGTRDALIRSRDLIASGPTLVSARFQPPNTMSLAQMNGPYVPKILGTEVYRFDDKGVDGQMYLAVGYMVIRTDYNNRCTAGLMFALGRNYSDATAKLGGLTGPVANKAFLWLPMEGYPYSYGMQGTEPSWTFASATASGILFTTASTRDWNNTASLQRSFLYVGRSFSATTSLPTNEVIIAARFNQGSWAGGLHDLNAGDWNQVMTTQFNYTSQFMIGNPQGTVGLAVASDLFTMLPNDNSGMTALNDEFLMGGPYIWGGGMTTLLFGQGSPGLFAPTRARVNGADVTLGSETWSVTPVDACFFGGSTGGKLWLRSS